MFVLGPLFWAIPAFGTLRSLMIIYVTLP